MSVDQQSTSNTGNMYALLTVRAFLFALGPIGYVALVQYGLNPQLIIAYFLIIGGVISLALNPALSAGKVRQTQIGVEVYGYTSRRAVLLLLVLAAITPLYYLCFVYAITLGTIIETSLLARLSPLLALPFAVLFLDERIVRVNKVLLAYACVFVAMGAMFYEQLIKANFDQIIPWMLGFAVAIVGAAEYIIMQKLSRHTYFKDYEIVGSTMLVGGGGFLLFLMINDISILRFPNVIELVGLIGLGFFTISVPHTIAMQLNARSRQPSLIAAGAYITVLFTAVLAYVLYGEQVNLITFLVASAGIFLGLWFLNSGTKK